MFSSDFSGDFAHAVGAPDPIPTPTPSDLPPKPEMRVTTRVVELADGKTHRYPVYTRP